MRLNSPLLTKFAGRFASVILRSVFRTLTIEVHSESVNPYDCSGDKRYLFSIWHDSAVIAAFGGPHARTVALTSRHRDGDFVAGIMGGIGVDVVRGSTGRNGRRAALELLRVAEAHDIVMTPDGPRGPRRKVSRGIVYLASRSGNGIVPTSFVCSRPWEIRGSWTTLTIPKPFSRVVAVAGEPVMVPQNIADGGLELFASQVQAAMDQLEQRAICLLNTPDDAAAQAIQSKPLAKAA